MHAPRVFPREASSNQVLRLTLRAEGCILVQMRRTVNLDAELESNLSELVSLTREKPAVIIRQALRAGLPALANRFQAPRPEGYFADDYRADRERIELESALRKLEQRPER